MEWLWLGAGLVIGSVIGWWWARRSVAPQLNDDQAEIAQLSERASRLETDLSAATERGTELERQLSDSETVSVSASAALEKATAELAASRQELTDTKQSMKALKHENQHSVAVAADLFEKLKAAGVASAEAHARYDQVTEEFVSIKRAVRQAEAERDQVRDDRDGTVSQLRDAAAAAERTASEAEASRAELDRKLSVAMARLEALEGCAESAAEAQEELRGLRTISAQHRRRVVELEAELVASKVTATPPLFPDSTSSSAAGRARSEHADGEQKVGGPEQAVPGGQQTSASRTEAAEGADAETGPAEDPVPRPADDIKTAEDEEIELLLDRVTPRPDSHPTDPPGLASSAVSAMAEEPDELQSIRGIGPKFEQLLRERSVVTFRQIAELENDEEWETYLDTFPGRINREEWRIQARALHRQKYGES